ncbi:AAA family ATPase [Microvirga sp. 3-52]|uniref:AAA family ATPase n=1 Tax=Microvirga sp. 3-52 TaxID=2792425 RepID=UPI001AC9C193|nr:AAA family ATPase [Microvirga sp. 3-52]MBO1905318.1 AAA family ATPase [Microvirga sp. 3-52]MBS7452593.1 AAA family ATPase [Microvirga sp. 3-52]
MAHVRTLPDRRREIAPRPADVGAALARGLLVRTLRQAGLHHVLREQPCIVGIAVADDDDRDVFVGAAKALLRATVRDGFDPRLAMLDPEYEVITFEGGRRKRSKADIAYLRERLSSRSRLLALAPTQADFPQLFRAAADAIVTPDPIHPRALRGAMQVVLGYPPPADLVEAAGGVPLAMIGAIFRPDRSLRQAVRLLTAAQTGGATSPSVHDARDAPTLDDLHGLGEAAEWGRSLALDMADYRAGRIRWRDMDKGILVSGPPGTGKTIFAKALGSTCMVPVHLHSLARWQGKGHLDDLLKAMRRAFEEAKADAPCILFVDELDSFGDRERLSGHNEQYSREVINGFLECLDGAEAREGVVVVGATNLPDRIDPAIRRPGRLDRHVVIPLPDPEARKGILRHHLGGALPGADLTEAAERLEGTSGAVIEQVVRDARRIARRERRDLGMHDLTAALPPRRHLSQADFRRVCVHEAGHAVVGCLLLKESGMAPVETRVFREASADSNAGVTLMRHATDLLRTRSAYLAQITGLMAGIAAEEVVLGARSDGGGGSKGADLQKATALAAAMEVSLGFGENLAYLSSRDEDELLARVRADPILRRAVNQVLAGSLERARLLVRTNGDAVNELADVLARLGRASFDEILGIVATIRNGSAVNPMNPSDSYENCPRNGLDGVDSLRAVLVSGPLCGTQ